MIPLSLLIACLGWFDVPPRQESVGEAPWRELSNRERRRLTGNWK